MKILVIGSGGREHALVWKLAQSPKVKKIFAAPGNGGISQLAECVDIKADDIDSLIEFANKERIDLTVVGPEAPLVNSIVDEFEKSGLPVFGPSKAAAALEASKVFAKEFMARYNIPTAEFKVFGNSEEAKKSINNLPVVIKADGLAQGKGVFVCKTKDEAIKAIEAIMEKKLFGEAGDKIVIEDCLEGEEASILVITDGKNIIPLESSQDHKQIFDGDKGPNTGGMGAYSPAPVVNQDLFKEILNNIFRPTIEGMSKEGRVFKGVLYAGLMITKAGPKVLEFNVRFGDPETQAILPRLNNGLVEVMLGAIAGRLDKINTLNWDSRPCVCVVLASGGYPGSYEKGKEISGLEDVANMKDIVVFHAGTLRLDSALNSFKYVTNGGRVLGITGLGYDIKQAIEHTYKAVEKIKFDKVHYRKDIGFKAISNIKNQILKSQFR